MIFKNPPSIVMLLSFIFALLSCGEKTLTDSYDTDKQKLVTYVEKYDWEAPQKVISLIEPNIYLTETASHKIGMSKFGGTPDLPASISWPHFEKEPMVFFGQINLTQTADLDKENLLPKRGMLYFFAHFVAPESDYGSAYDFQMKKEKYKVLYFDGNSDDLAQADFPVEMPKVFQSKAVPLKMGIDFRLPGISYTWKVKNAGLSEKDFQLYEQLLDEYEFCQDNTMLGTPCPIQDALEVDWAYSYLESTDYKSETVKDQVEALRPEFINLLSFGLEGSFEAIGSSGCYFGILKSDLEKTDFSKAVFVLQDT